MTKQNHMPGLFTVCNGELFAAVDSPIPGHLSMSVGPFGFVIPLPGGIGHGDWLDMTPNEIRDYLNHGMVLSGDLVIESYPGGLSLTGGSNLKSLEETSPLKDVDRVRIRAITDIAVQLSQYRDARLVRGIEVDLQDWQGPDREDKTTPDSVRLRVDIEDQRILVTTRDGRKVDMEMQDGNIRVMAYEADDGKEAPVVTILPLEGDILTDREDYDREARIEPDEPGM